MRADQGRKDNRQLGKLVHFLPVIGKQQNNTQSDENGTDAEKYYAAPGQAFPGCRIARPQGSALVGLDDAFLDPQINFGEQPLDVFFHDCRFDFLLKGLIAALLLMQYL
jgi:hypothetical protein